MARAAAPALAQQAKPLTVTKAARLAGVPASTLRFYERQGLVAPSGKSRAGYRLYDADAVARLRFVRAAQAIGLPLKDIRAVVGMDARTSRREMRALLESRLHEVEAKLDQLNTVRDALSGALARCRRSGTGDCCSVLVSLSVGTGTINGGSCDEPDHEGVHLQDRGRDCAERGGAGGRDGWLPSRSPRQQRDGRRRR